MPENDTNSPDQVPASGDPGDETARRYRYQWTYAAIMCCMMLDDTQDVTEVFCEQHEDILLKHDDDSFTGLQVKTRATDQDPWKANHADVKRSCARFAILESQFPGKFRSFRFLTNHPMYSASNGRDLQYVLEQIAYVPRLADLSGPSLKFLRSIAKEAECSEEVAFTALKRTTACDDLPKLADAKMRLMNSITDVWQRASEYSYTAVTRAAQALVTECMNASSLSHEDALPAYIPASSDSLDQKLKALLDGKKINKQRLLQVLDLGLEATITLDADPNDFAEPGSGDTALLRKKLEAGEFSAVSQNSAEELRNSADYLSIKWTKKHGRNNGLQRYDHIRKIVLADSARAFEIVKRNDEAFGIDMLETLRNLFDDRRKSNATLYDCSNDHLEGFAYSLTSECKVQWSINRPWEDE